MSPDTTELIKDSSAAEEFQDWYADYDSCAFRNLYGNRKPPTSKNKKSTRVIQRFLEGKETDVEEKIWELSHSCFKNEDSTASLCRKEQELKPDGRLFVKQTYMQRLGQTSMEANIANQFMRYVPEQTMTDGELQLMRRLTGIAKSQRSNIIEIFNLDLSKWNMRFRHGLVKPFGDVLDELFGTKELYTNNHLWFLTANIFCNSRLAPPDYDENFRPIPGEFFYNNHLRGMEGMRQKLWTIITICLIKLAAETTNVNISIMCQGDNQVILANYSNILAESREGKRLELLSTLERLLSSVNLILKREKLGSLSNYVNLGKSDILGERQFQMQTKR